MFTGRLIDKLHNRDTRQEINYLRKQLAKTKIVRRFRFPHLSSRGLLQQLQQPTNTTIVLECIPAQVNN